MLQLEPYDGTTYLIDYLESFKALMILHGAIDGILCRAFPTTLREVAQL